MQETAPAVRLLVIVVVTDRALEFAVSFGGAKGIRTPDPHTASVVRYQLRHSPKMCLSKLHHGLPAIKVAAQPASSSAGNIDVVCVSGANIQTTAAASMIAPLTVKPHAKLKCSAIWATAMAPTIAPKSAII